MNRRRMLPALLGGLLLGALLGGCSGSDDDRAAAPLPVQGPYAAMARGWVDVEGGLVRVAAQRAGTVQAVRVNEGDAVTKGQVLAVLDPRLGEIDQSLDEASLKEALAQVQVLSARLPQAQRHAAHLREAAAQKAASGESADEAREAVEELKAEIAAAKAKAEVERQRLAKARYEHGLDTIRAPVAGHIVRRVLQPGQHVSATASGGSALFELLPDRPRIVRAEVGEDFIDRIHKGMKAEVVPYGSGAKAVAASVLRVGEVFGPNPIADDPAAHTDTRDVECVLSLQDSAGLRYGQRVLVRFKR